MVGALAEFYKFSKYFFNVGKVVGSEKIPPQFLAIVDTRNANAKAVAFYFAREYLVCDFVICRDFEYARNFGHGVYYNVGTIARRLLVSRAQLVELLV